MAKRGRPKHPDILTPREWEVLALLREGLTNDQIAGRLNITERTVKYHVAEILGKLGVASRQEAAAWSDSGQRRGWWQRALVPGALIWPKLPLGWLAPAAAGVTAIGVAAGVGLLVWGLVRTEGDGDNLVALQGPTPTLTPVDPATVDPPDELVWTRDGAVGMRSVDPATCGDADTAEAYGVPMALDFPVDVLQFPTQEVSPWMLGLEAEPYEYVPAQVGVQAWSGRAPMGWEASTRSRFALNIPTQPQPPEIFLRRLDQPSVLFRYSTQHCEPTTTAIIEPSRMVIPPEPEIVVHREGDYLSFDEAAELALVDGPPAPASARIIAAELGSSVDFDAPRNVMYPRGVQAEPNRVVWSFLFVVGDEAGPQRPGQAIGFEITIDASTGDFVMAGCCVDLVMPPEP